MDDLLTKLMDNFKKYKEDHPDIDEAIKEGYEVGIYDEETQMIITVSLEAGNLKVKIIEDGRIIRVNTGEAA